jgi:hypothetical protein
MGLADSGGLLLCFASGCPAAPSFRRTPGIGLRARIVAPLETIAPIKYR